MSDNSFLYALGGLAIVAKIVVLGNIVHRRTRPSQPASGPTTVPNSVDLIATERRQVLVEDPMTQRIIRSFDNESVISFSEIKVPPPVYTPKDQHLEFSGYDAPPPFSAEANSPVIPTRSRSGNGSSSSRASRSATRNPTIVVTIASPSIPEPAQSSSSPRRPDLPSPPQHRQYPISALCPSIIVHI